MHDDVRFKTFAEFYPFYLSEHRDLISRRLHVIGSSIAVVLLISALVSQLWFLIGIAVIQGYACAWVGHFFFEHNRPATFTYPRYSLMGDWRLWWETVTGKRPW